MVVFRPNQGVETTFTNIQLEASNTPTTYSTFNGGEKSINLGKNLLTPRTGQTSNGITGTVNDDGSVHISGTASAGWSNFVTITNETLPAGTYTFSVGLPADEVPFTFEAQLTMMDDTIVTMDVKPMGQTSRPTKTYSKPIKKIRINTGSMTVNQQYDLTIYPMIVKGCYMSDYASYFTPIELCKIGTYQDKIYFDSDTSKWMLHKEVGKVVFDGTADEAWGSAPYGTNSFNIALNDRAVPSESTPNMNMSNLFRGVPYVQRTTAGNNIIYNDVSFGLYIRNTSYASLADFKTMLSSSPLISYYALATATDTEITNANLLAQLNATASLYNGINNISFIPSAEAQGTIEVKTLKVYSQETILTPPTAVRLTLTDDGIINPCGCRKNIQLKMRETAQ